MSATATAPFAVIPTAAVSDALDRCGLAGQLDEISALRPGLRMVGPAFTVRYEPVGAQGGTVGDFLDDVPTGGVVVIDNQGRTDCTVWGGIMTAVAAAKGVAGTVVHGTCRDVATSIELEYPIWSCSRFMRTGKDRVRLAAIQDPIRIGDVTVRPNDIVCADDDGVLVVPAERVEEITGIAARIDQVEADIVAAVRSGSTLVGARNTFGYHHLQTRTKV